MMGNGIFIFINQREIGDVEYNVSAWCSDDLFFFVVDKLMEFDCLVRRDAKIRSKLCKT